MIPSLPQIAHVVSWVHESHKVRSLVLDLHLEAEPGQFVMAWLPGVDEKPFSLVRAAPVTLTIARVGPFTEAVHRLNTGDRLWIRGPLGQPFKLPRPMASQAEEEERQQGSRTRSPLLLVGGGYGVAPLYFLAEDALAAGWEVRAIIGAQTASDVVFAGRFQSLEVPFVVTTDDGSLGEKGLATDAAARILEQEAFLSLYACGPEAMLHAAEKLARAHGLPAQLSYEGIMRCGFGVCGSCARDGWLACRDGPVRAILP